MRTHQIFHHPPIILLPLSLWWLFHTLPKRRVRNHCSLLALREPKGDQWKEQCPVLTVHFFGAPVTEFNTDLPASLPNCFCRLFIQTRLLDSVFWISILCCSYEVLGKTSPSPIDWFLFLCVALLLFDRILSFIALMQCPFGVCFQYFRVHIELGPSFPWLSSVDWITC